LFVFQQTLLKASFQWARGKTNNPAGAGLFKFCGERGIRTPGTLVRYTRFPGVPVKPLLHLSLVVTFKNSGAN
jgi:hypothetical protein